MVTTPPHRRRGASNLASLALPPPSLNPKYATELTVVIMTSDKPQMNYNVLINNIVSTIKNYSLQFTYMLSSRYEFLYSTVASYLLCGRPGVRRHVRSGGRLSDRPTLIRRVIHWHWQATTLKHVTSGCFRVTSWHVITHWLPHTSS